MSEAEMMKKNYVGYEYKDIRVDNNMISMYLDGYECFGWTIDENSLEIKEGLTTTIHLKRDRKILNKMELTRLQRHYEDCMRQIKTLEQNIHKDATLVSITVGMIGTAFMAGSVFAITAEPPIVWLCILLAIPAFIGWLVPYFLYKTVSAKKEEQIQPLIENKQNEIYEICEKGYHLLHE